MVFEHIMIRLGFVWNIAHYEQEIKLLSEHVQSELESHGTYLTLPHDLTRSCKRLLSRRVEDVF